MGNIIYGRKKTGNIIYAYIYLYAYEASSTNLSPLGWKFSTITGDHELNQRAIGVWKYVRTWIHAYLENQVKNHSKIGNTVNNQKYKISRSNFSKAPKEKKDNMLYIMRQTSLFLLWNIIIMTVGTL